MYEIDSRHPQSNLQINIKRDIEWIGMKYRIIKIEDIKV